MKIYSVSRYPSTPKFVDVEDLSIVVSPSELLELAAFFAEAAKAVSLQSPNDPDGWHLHFRDEWREWKEHMSDVVVSLEPAGKS
jgi:hypothetical protein